MIPTGADIYDPALARMIAAFQEGDGWNEVHDSLRDAMVSYARARSPYYRRRIPPGVRFEEIPLLRREDVREHLEDLLAEGVPPERRVLKRTSGSTGEPLLFYRDSAQGALEEGSAHRFLLRMQGLPRDATRVWLSTHPEPVPPELRSRFPRLARGRTALRNRLRRGDPPVHPISAIVLTSRRLDRELRTWGSFRSWWLYGHASAIDRVADQIETRGLPLRRPPKAIVTTADDLTPPAERRMSRVFGCPIHSWYGSHEMNGYVAGTLPGTRRYAFNPFLVHVEVTDETGRPLAPGEEGLLVLTDLNNLVMPFVRYVTGDLARMSEEGGGAGAFPLIDGLAGRAPDAILLPDGRRLTVVLLGATLFGWHGTAEHVRAYQCQEVRPRELELRVVWSPDADGEVRDRVDAEFRRLAGPGVSTRVRDVAEVERLPSGKAWIVRGLDRP